MKTPLLTALIAGIALILYKISSRYIPPPFGTAAQSPGSNKKPSMSSVGESLENILEHYQKNAKKILDADKKGDINGLIRQCRAGLKLIEPYILYIREQNKLAGLKPIEPLSLHSIPALDKALIYFAIKGNVKELNQIKTLADTYEELREFKDKLDEAYKRKAIAQKIYNQVKANKDTVQQELKHSLDFDDGNFIANTVYYMEKAGMINRIKSGNKTLLNV